MKSLSIRTKSLHNLLCFTTLCATFTLCTISKPASGISVTPYGNPTPSVYIDMYIPYTVGAYVASSGYFVTKIELWKYINGNFQGVAETHNFSGYSPFGMKTWNVVNEAPVYVDWGLVGYDSGLYSATGTRGTFMSIW